MEFNVSVFTKVVMSSTLNLPNVVPVEMSLPAFLKLLSHSIILVLLQE